MKRPVEHEYTSQVAYTRALEAYCDSLERLKQAQKQESVVGTKTWFEDDKLITQNLYPSDIYDTPQHRVDETAKQEHEKAERAQPVAFIDMREWPPIRWREGMVRADVAPFDGQGLFFAPPQRQPLTDEEIERLIFRSGGHKSTQNLMSNPMQVREYVELWNERIYKFARAIEAAHGIKGEA